MRSRVRRWLVVIVVWITAIALTVSVYFTLIYDPADYETLYSRCEELELGMSRDEVLTVMGKPKEVQFRAWDTTTHEIWIYDNRPGLSTPLYCSFDSAGQTTVRIVCGERSFKYLKPDSESDSLER